MLTGEGGPDEKFFGTFPYPYMNGLLHLGHAFSLSKVRRRSAGCERSLQWSAGNSQTARNAVALLSTRRAAACHGLLQDGAGSCLQLTPNAG